MADWYGGGPDFDEAVRDLAADWRDALRSQPPQALLADPDTALAGAILFDQVPRNLSRGGAEAFAHDRLAPPTPPGHHRRAQCSDRARQYAYISQFAPNLLPPQSPTNP